MHLYYIGSYLINSYIVLGHWFEWWKNPLYLSLSFIIYSSCQCAQSDFLYLLSSQCVHENCSSNLCTLSGVVKKMFFNTMWLAMHRWLCPWITTSLARTHMKRNMTSFHPLTIQFTDCPHACAYTWSAILWDSQRNHRVHGRYIGRIYCLNMLEF